MYVCMCKKRNTHTHIYIYMGIQQYTVVHTYIYIYQCIYIYVNINIYIYTHTIDHTLRSLKIFATPDFLTAWALVPGMPPAQANITSSSTTVSSISESSYLEIGATKINKQLKHGDLTTENIDLSAVNT